MWCSYERGDDGATWWMNDVPFSQDDRFSFSFFGDFGFGGQQAGHREVPKGGDVVMDLDVTLEELFAGNFIEVRCSPTT